MPPWRGERRRRLVLVAVALLHAALLWRWASTPRARPEAVPPATVVVRLLARPAPAPAPATAVDAAPRRPAAVVRQRSPRPAGRSADVPNGVYAADPPAVVEAAAPPASAPPAAGLDADATARAIREIARAPGLGARAGRVGPAEASPAQHLGEGIARGARGDCLKGEYLGAGMGLLSVPFLAAAALRDACRH